MFWLCDDMEEKKKKRKNPTARIEQMRMDTALTDSPGSQRTPQNLVQPRSGTVLCFSFRFVQKYTPIAGCDASYLTAERSHNQKNLAKMLFVRHPAGFRHLSMVSWSEKKGGQRDFLENYSIKWPICSFPLAESLKVSLWFIQTDSLLRERATGPILIFPWLCPMHIFFFLSKSCWVWITS